MENNLGTEPVTAPVTPVNWINPRQKIVERQGSRAEAYVHHYPEVRGGVCEWCGVIDKNVESQHQYKLCPHYRGQQLACSYCPATKEPDDVNRKSVLHITDSPTDPNALIVVCDAYECTKLHQERFQRNRS